MQRTKQRGPALCRPIRVYPIPYTSGNTESAEAPSKFGPLAPISERLVCTEEDVGGSPTRSTNSLAARPQGRSSKSRSGECESKGMWHGHPRAPERVQSLAGIAQMVEYWSEKPVTRIRAPLPAPIVAVAEWFSGGWL